MELKRPLQVYKRTSNLDGHSNYFIEYHDSNFKVIQKPSTTTMDVYCSDLKDIFAYFKESGIKFTGFVNQVPEVREDKLIYNQFAGFLNPTPVKKEFSYGLLPQEDFDEISKKFPKDNLEEKVEEQTENKFAGYGCYVTVGHRLNY